MFILLCIRDSRRPFLTRVCAKLEILSEMVYFCNLAVNKFNFFTNNGLPTKCSLKCHIAHITSRPIILPMLYFHDEITDMD